MTDILAQPPDIEKLVVDYLVANINEPTATVSIGVPAGWMATTSPPHIEVDSFSVSNEHPILYRPRVRLIARAASTTEAKRLVSKALGVLAAHPGGDGIINAIPLLGPDPVRDDATHSELASVELSVSVRSIPIT